MTSKYVHYSKKDFESLDENGKALTQLRAEQEADRLIGMRPDLARAQYCLLLSKILGEKATALGRKLAKSNQPKEPSSERASIWGDE